MKILVGFERFGKVRDELRARGHDAWSCDIEESVPPSPYHIRGNIWTLLNNTVSEWDAAIFFPVCTYMCGSGLHHNKNDVARALKTDLAVQDAIKLMDLPIPRIIMENPVGILSTMYRKPDVIVQPYMFGDDASKKTCFWMKAVKPLPLPKSGWAIPRMVEYPKGSGKYHYRWSNQTDSGQNKLGPSKNRAAERGKTYDGIAKYLADCIEQY